jgi:hypothetical protein
LDLSPDFQALAASLAGSALRNSASAVADRIRGLKATNDSQSVINELEELVNELISDKNDLTRIAQAYQAELVAQRLSAGDVQYITNAVVPLLETLASQGSDPQGTEKVMGMIKPLLSIDTVNVLQLLGFNFRKAIGEPLTALVEHAILSKASTDANLELQRLQLERELAYIAVARDPEAHARLSSMM